MFNELPALGFFAVLVALVGVSVWAMSQFVRVLALRRSLLGKGMVTVPTQGVWGDIYRHLDSIRRVKDQGDADGWRNSLEQGAESLPYGLVVAARSGRIKWFNATGARLLNLSLADDIGRDINHLVRQIEFDVAFRNAEAQTEIELEVSGKNLLAYISPFGDGAYRLISLQDISYVRYLEIARSEMLGNVSHELKTPLTVIRGYADVISSAASSSGEGGIVTAAAHVAKQAERMNCIVDDLLTLERLEETRLPVEQVEQIDLRSLASEIVMEMGVIESDWQCKVEIDIAENVQVHGRFLEFRSVLLNLIANAMRHSPAAGVVRVSWFNDDNGGHLAVSDQGDGIEAVHLPRLTERFYRADKSRSRKLGGTGLGLAIVKRVLQRHGASLRIETELGKGSVFYCDFPSSSLSALAIQSMQ